jgi:hypothetical protein
MPETRASARGGGGRWLAAIAGLLLVGVGIGVVVLLVEIAQDEASHRDQRWFGHLAALELIIALSVIFAVVRGVAVRRSQSAAGQPPQPVPGILIGADNRLSTSKLSAFAWTWVLGWALLSLFFADWAGEHAGWQAFLKQGIQDEYLVLLGGPFVALVSAKAFVSSGVANGTQVKTKADASETTPAHRVAQAFSDDSGQTDLVDTQYLLFGSIALLVFIVMFLRAPGKGLPTLPEALIALASVGTTAYIANKWTAKDAKPHLEMVVPSTAKRGANVVVYGTNLLTVSQGGKRAPANEPVEFFFGSLAEARVSPDAPGAVANPTGSDYVTVKVPGVADSEFHEGKRVVDIAARNAIGVTSDNAVSFTIEQ